MDGPEELWSPEVGVNPNREKGNNENTWPCLPRSSFPFQICLHYGKQIEHS